MLQARPAEAEAELSFAAVSDLRRRRSTRRCATGLPPPQRQALEVALLLREAGDRRPTHGRRPARSCPRFTILSKRRSLSSSWSTTRSGWIERPCAPSRSRIRRLPRRAGVVVASRAGTRDQAPLDLERDPESRGESSTSSLRHCPSRLCTTSSGSRLGLKLPRPMLVRVADASGGNPFDALEIAGRPRPPSGTRPPSVTSCPCRGPSTICCSDRLDRLSPPATGSGIGRVLRSPPDHRERRRCASTRCRRRGGRRCWRPRRPAHPRIGWGDRLRFSHPLLASTIYGSFTGARRRLLHLPARGRRRRPRGGGAPSRSKRRPAQR